VKKWEERDERGEVDFKTTMVGGVKVVGFEVLGLTFIYVIHFAFFFSLLILYLCTKIIISV